ncbi:MAG: hypothetical protein ACRD3M_03450 [Thermoanaerobaculia bacterium]
MAELVLIFLAAMIAAVGLAFVLCRAAVAFFQYRGKRIVTCPETNAPVGVEVDALHAAATAPFGGGPELRLKRCTRWPERKTCGQNCLTQIEEAPKQCLVRTRLERWYAGTECVLCGAPIGEIHWFDHRPAFLGPGRKPAAWSDVLPEHLPQVLATHERICWNCYVTESFRFEHPDLVVEDPRPANRAER